MKTKQQHSNTCYGIGCLVVFLLFLSSHFVRGQGQSRSVAKPVGTERRIALVIGNADYLGTAYDLQNPLNDANDMEAALKKLGFEVIKVLNTDRVGMSRAINAFRDRLSSADVAFFYYAGHGVSFANKNYLLPTDYDADCLEQIEDYGIALSRVLGDIAAKNVKNSFVVLDACRNLPDLRICDATKRDLGSNTALVKPTNNPRGSAVVYATEEGTKAEDRSPNGRNGLFTGALLQYLTTPDLSLRNILDQASLEVERLSNGSQTPARYEKIYGDFYFLKTQGYTPPPPVRSTKFLDLPFAEMVYVEGGTFEMGSNNGDKDAQDNEMVKGKKHSVTVSSFLMGKYEVTQAQWRAVMGSDPPELYNKNCDDCPVEGVSWNNVQEFLQKLNARTGGNYRLPTEAEWEYAARGGKSWRDGYTYAGGNDLRTMGWFDGNYQESKHGAQGTTHPVGKKLANQLGIHDLSGNVREWCNDVFDPDWYAQTAARQPNPENKAFGLTILRVSRGGSWRSYARVATRDGGTRNDHLDDCGFRLVSQSQ